MNSGFIHTFFPQAPRSPCHVPTPLLSLLMDNTMTWTYCKAGHPLGNFVAGNGVAFNFAEKIKYSSTFFQLVFQLLATGNKHHQRKLVQQSCPVDGQLKIAGGNVFRACMWKPAYSTTQCRYLAFCSNFEIHLYPSQSTRFVSSPPTLLTRDYRPHHLHLPIWPPLPPNLLWPASASIQLLAVVTLCDLGHQEVADSQG